MDIAALLAIGGMILSAPTTDTARDLRQDYLAIAEKVAGPGRPDCTAYHPDGHVTACVPQFSIRYDRQINAWSLGGHIQFSSGAVERLSAEEFALLAGHEIAHYYLGHQHSSITNELEADWLGALLACRAGFPVASAMKLFRHARGSNSHPAPLQRRNLLAGMNHIVDCGESTAAPAEQIALMD